MTTSPRDLLIDAMASDWARAVRARKAGEAVRITDLATLVGDLDDDGVDRLFAELGVGSLAGPHRPPGRDDRRASRGLRFALVPRATAWTLLAAMLGLTGAPSGVVAAQPPPPKQPSIKLPPNRGGESDGSDNAAPEQPAAEDAPEPPAEAPPPPAEQPPAQQPPSERPAQPPAQTPQVTQPPASPQAPTPAEPPADPPAEPVGPPPEAPPAPQAAPPTAPPPAAAGLPTLAEAALQVVKLPARARHARARVRLAAPAPTPASSETARMVVAGGSARPREVRVSSAMPARLSGGAYTVRAGESLWSIAERILGAGASDREVGSLVGEIWALNADRIGTGDPDRLPVGVTLRLPRAEGGERS